MASGIDAVSVALATTTALVDQFLGALAPNAKPDAPSAPIDAPSPLLLLEAASKSLKAQVTKTTLLTVTAPFTPSAISVSLKTINESILPSLVTATLLITPDAFTVSFAKEVRGLCRVALRELLNLSKHVEKRSKDGRPKSEPSKAQKAETTEATGRVWEACDTLVLFSQQGLPGFAVRKAQQWLELMKDAVKELEEWDPKDDIDDDDPFDEADSEDEHASKMDHANGADDRATISAGVKEQALRVLNRIPQSIHVVVKQRLAKFRPPKDEPLREQTRETLEYIVISTRRVSEMLDEAAEGMYLGDSELCLKKAGEARALTIDIVEKVALPLDGRTVTTSASNEGQPQTTEDKYVQRALQWIRQVDTTPG